MPLTCPVKIVHLPFTSLAQEPHDVKSSRNVTRESGEYVNLRVRIWDPANHAVKGHRKKDWLCLNVPRIRTNIVGISMRQHAYSVKIVHLAIIFLDAKTSMQEPASHAKHARLALKERHAVSPPKGGVYQ